MFKTREEIEKAIEEKNKELKELEQAPEVSRGVKKLGDHRFVATAWKFKLGEYRTEKEAATAYNEHVKEKFSFPVYNKKGDVIGQKTTYEVSVPESSRDSLKEYNDKSNAIYETYYKPTIESEPEVETSEQEKAAAVLIPIE